MDEINKLRIELTKAVKNRDAWLANFYGQEIQYRLKILEDIELKRKNKIDLLEKSETSAYIKYMKNMYA